MVETSVTHLKKKTPSTYALGVFFFRSPAPLRATALEPAAHRPRVFRPVQSQTLGFVYSGLTLLSYGEPHVTETTNPEIKKGPP